MPDELHSAGRGEGCLEKDPCVHHPALPARPFPLQAFFPAPAQLPWALAAAN